MKKLLLIIFLFITLHCFAEPTQAVIQQNIQAAKNVFHCMYNCKDNVTNLVEWNRFNYFNYKIGANYDTLKTDKDKTDFCLMVSSKFKKDCISQKIAEKNFHNWKYWREYPRGIVVIGEINQKLMYFWMHTDEKSNILMERINYESPDVKLRN